MSAKQWLALVVVAWIVHPSRLPAQCFPAEAASDFCTSARVIPGDPGHQEVVMNVAGATGAETRCGVPVGHTVWFKIVPTQTGRITFSTCHPATTYDTVLEVYAGGDSMCEFMASVTCNDDTHVQACINGCSAYGSHVTFDATAGTVYRIVVGSFNYNIAQCNLCLGVYATICGNDLTPPVTQLTAPAALSCNCGNVPITGTAHDPDGGFTQYRLEYMPADGGAWTPIVTSQSQVQNGPLGNWNTAGLPQGYYLLKLTTENACGLSDSAIVVVWVSSYLDSLQIRQPTNAQILGGTIPIDGTVWDHCQPGGLTVRYRPTGGTLMPITALSPPWVVNDPLGSWDTRAGIVDGLYEVRVDGTDFCGVTTLESRTITVDNTPPIAVIATPTECGSVVSGQVEIGGTAFDAYLAGWTLQYTGGDAHGWVPIRSGTAPIVNGLLGTWDTSGLRPCTYTLRLVVTDRSVIDGNSALHNQSEYTVSTEVGVHGDFDYDNDGDVDAEDFAIFQRCTSGPTVLADPLCRGL